MSGDPHEDAQRGQQARALLDNPLLVEAFGALERDYMAAWKGTAARDTDARERLWIAVSVVERVKGHLQTVVENGKLAEAEIRQLEGRKARSFLGL